MIGCGGGLRTRVLPLTRRTLSLELRRKECGRLRRESHPQPRAYQARALLSELLNRVGRGRDRNGRTCTSNRRPVAPVLCLFELRSAVGLREKESNLQSPLSKRGVLPVAPSRKTSSGQQDSNPHHALIWRSLFIKQPLCPFELCPVLYCGVWSRTKTSGFRVRRPAKVKRHRKSWLRAWESHPPLLCL